MTSIAAAPTRTTARGESLGMRANLPEPLLERHVGERGCVGGEGGPGFLRHRPFRYRSVSAV